jgi:FkbM family methyltransferase
MKIDHDVRFVVRESAIIEDIFEKDAYRFRPWVEKQSDPPVVVDLGANLGAFTLLAASYGCKVIAVEADPTLVSALRQNLAANSWANATVVNAAVTATLGLRWMHSSGTVSGGLMRAHEGFKPIEVVSLTLQEICTQHRVFEFDGIAAYGGDAFLKCDIEGAECEVFGHDLETVKDFDAISMEWHNFDALLFKALLEEDYEVTLEGTGHPPTPYDPTIGGGLLHAREIR